MSKDECAQRTACSKGQVCTSGTVLYEAVVPGWRKGGGARNAHNSKKSQQSGVNHMCEKFKLKVGGCGSAPGQL